MTPSGILSEDDYPMIEIKNVRVWVRMRSNEKYNTNTLKEYINSEYNKYINSIMSGIL